MKNKILTTLLMVPIFLSVLLGVAHFFRGSQTFLQVCCVLLLPLLIFRHPISGRIVQVALMLLSIEWGFTAYQLVTARMAADEDWQRLAAILIAVTLFTLFSSSLFITRRLATFYCFKQKTN